MVEARTYADSEGEFRGEKKDDCACRACGKREVTYRIWESSCGGYEDVKYTCHACGYRWWVDGIDS
jgi:DNA-directed RNA polymerase subunit M/transcription elongation factor TFIIS